MYELLNGNRQKRIRTVIAVHSIIIFICGAITGFSINIGWELPVALGLFYFITISPFINGETMIHSSVMKNTKWNLFFRVSQLLFSALIISAAVFGS